MRITIRPNVNDDTEDFDYLFGLLHQVKDRPSELELNFSKCVFLRQNAVAFLGGFIRLAQTFAQVKVSVNQHGKIHFGDEKVRKNLERNGFLKTLGLPCGEADSGNSISYREDRTRQQDAFTHYLREDWLGRGWVHVTDTLKSFIISPMLEAYINVFDHADSLIGVVSCGQHYPIRKELKLTLIDFGVGIPFTVREYLKKPDMKASDALQWAFQPGATTKIGPLTRGLGLKELKRFVKTNQGKLEIYSDRGYVCIDHTREDFRDRITQFKGTVVQITLNCDEQLYTTDNEFDTDESWF
jgi:signal transduction histidine kinase